ncbi:hypothetical protein CONPUDRAFT_150576 [Coniophora puteana RWD-64-598 SS2]|uniref:DUF6593 domain-containing protein n=1 Tax=Coniophora puteana (strain RWD-64-598) TaxID=741705 RepID=A0A5M3N320_CONPW|nr:uncharacterized protein CONPUDRAFT_150576 [Coniophora puteana RWD-64-598 SS2]EIW85792.1 hypothetical protein CONPUDRAFT_150576 [Coniophora puteana RWD-64-598 SS2]
MPGSSSASTNTQTPLCFEIGGQDLLNTTFTAPDGTRFDISTAPVSGGSATMSKRTEVGRRRETIESLHGVGRIDWPIDEANLTMTVGWRVVNMIRTGTFTSSEKFIANDGKWYEWQIHNGVPKLFLLNTASLPFEIACLSTPHRSWWQRSSTARASLVVQPEGTGNILDDIVVTFICFVTRWRLRERRRRSSNGGVVIGYSAPTGAP